VSVGKDSLKALVDGDGSNTAVGFEAAMTTTTNTQITAIGYRALKVAVANNSTAVGFQALKALTGGANCVAVGNSALASVIGGNNNNALGGGAGLRTTTGIENISIGNGALEYNISGDWNVSVGNNAGASQGTSDGNTFVGWKAGYSVNEGAYNTAVGFEALVGMSNEPDYNTAVGHQAGKQITSGNNNLALGTEALRSGSPGGAVTTGNNIIGLGDENIGACHVQVDWTVASDKRDKTDVKPIKMGLDFVKKLEPVTYHWDKRSKYVNKHDPAVNLNNVVHTGKHKEDWTDVGFLAQDVEKLEEEYGHKMKDKSNLTTSLSEDGKQYGLQYSKFVPILTKAIQELADTVETLQNEIKELKENT
jgi:hypothetical protein